MTTARINPDSRPVLFVAVAITVALALTSFLLSYAGLVAVAEWAAVPAWLAWAVPVTIDGAILVYTLAALVFRARAEGARVAWLSLSLFTALSVAANAAHAWDAGGGDGRAALGAVIAGLAPVAVLLTTHTIARLIIAPAPAPEVAPVAPLRELKRVETPTPAPALVTARPARSTPRPATGKSNAARDAEIFALADRDKLSTREIAARVGVSKSTVARILDERRKAIEAASAPAFVPASA